jgi:hypothetical protein
MAMAMAMDSANVMPVRGFNAVRRDVARDWDINVSPFTGLSGYAVMLPGPPLAAHCSPGYQI